MQLSKIFSLFFFISTLSLSNPSHSFAAKSSQSILGSSNAKKGGAYKHNIHVPPATLNPITAHDNYSLEVMHWMVESLLTHHENTYEWVPLLAEKFHVSSENKVITFYLRKNIRFHNNEELTAEDVKFSFDVYDTDLYRSKIEGEENNKIIDRIEIINRYTIRFFVKDSLFSNLEFIPFPENNSLNLSPSSCA